MDGWVDGMVNGSVDGWNDSDDSEVLSSLIFLR